MDHTTAKTCKNCKKEFNDGKESSLCADCRSKQGKRSKRKGNNNELRFAKKLQALFNKYELPYMVRRTPRSGAIHEFEPGDLLFTGLPLDSAFHGHWELKNTHSWLIENWFKKAEDIEKDLEMNRQPILGIRKPNSSKSYVVIDEDEFLKILIELELLKHG